MCLLEWTGGLGPCHPHIISSGGIISYNSNCFISQNRAVRAKYLSSTKMSLGYDATFGTPFSEVTS